MNHGPIGLQPIALPLSYIPSMLWDKKAGSYVIYLCQSHLAVEMTKTLKHFEISLKFILLGIVSVGGIMVSIAAFQAVDPGSIPGRRNF